MLYIYGLTLVLLSLILILLWEEEKRYKKNITHGLASKYWILREKRQYLRFNEGIKIRYKIRKDSLPFQESSTTNISRRGLCLTTYEKLKKNTYLDLELELPDFSNPVTVRGQVVWSKDLKWNDEAGRRRFNVGLKFYKIKPEAEAILLTHLNKIRPH